MRFATCSGRSDRLPRDDWFVFLGAGEIGIGASAPAMGRAAEELADRLWITSDNPRWENPIDIISEIIGGLKRPYYAAVEPDRARAIQWAIEEARPGDTVLICGKGHETCQERSGVRIEFRDQMVAAAAMRFRAPPHKS